MPWSYPVHGTTFNSHLTPPFSQPSPLTICAISPTVSLRDWPYERNAGLGGSGAWALLMGKDGVNAELDLGVGWQDPAVIAETGLCVWRSGARPELEFKGNAEFLRGRMALYWTGSSHDTPGVAKNNRDFDAIARAGKAARDAAWASSLAGLAAAVRQSYAVQLDEGMAPLSTGELPVKPLAWKYSGGGFGGYALYLCETVRERDRLCTVAGFRPIEPYVLSNR